MSVQKVAIHGAAGRMGRALILALQPAEDLELVAALAHSACKLACPILGTLRARGGVHQKGKDESKGMREHEGALGLVRAWPGACLLLALDLVTKLKKEDRIVLIWHRRLGANVETHHLLVVAALEGYVRER